MINHINSFGDYPKIYGDFQSIRENKIEGLKEKVNYIFLSWKGQHTTNLKVKIMNLYMGQFLYLQMLRYKVHLKSTKTG